MRILLAVLMLAVPAFGQAPAGPVQGPPPKNLTKQADGHISANASPADSDKFEIHIVQTGETLSQIAGVALKDSRLWPQLWESNEHVVNPHWIYPNDKILIRPVTRITEATPPPPPVEPPPPPKVVEAIQPPPPPPPPPVPASRGIAVLRNLIVPPVAAPKTDIVFDLTPQQRFSGIKHTDLYCSGFIRGAAITNPIKVTSTYQRNEAALSTDGQYVHIGAGSGGGVTAGSMYQVIRPTKKVLDSSRPGPAGNLGMHYLDIGVIQVTQTQADSALARVIENCEAVEVGDVMIPFVHYDLPDLPGNRPFSTTMTTPGSLSGSLVFSKNIVASASSTFRTSAAFPNEGSIVGEGGVVYINLGKSENVKSGDLFIVYRGKTAIGEIALLKVDDKSSSALVTYSSQAFVLGDRVERR